MTVLEMPTKIIPEMDLDWPPDSFLPDLAALEGLDLPGDDGEPMENERERIQINLGLESLDQVWADREDFYAGGNMFVYYSLAQARTVLAELADPGRQRTAFRGPDLFVVLDVDGSYRRQKWVVWEEEGRYPDLIIEFLSASTRRLDLREKKRLYERTFGVREYFCFDYMDPEAEGSLLGWRLSEQGRYQAIQADERGWLWSEVLGLWLGRWQGTVARDETTWLRFYTPEGELALTPTEAERQRAEAAEAALARLHARLAERGLTLD